MGNVELGTAVGVPFYEQETQECLDTTLRNLDECLAQLGIDAPVIVMVNGPETEAGRPPSFDVKGSQYNADITLVHGGRAGQVNAINDIVVRADELGLDRIFITDADISRFPDAMKCMWEQADRPLVGAHYTTYPVEVAEAGFRPMTDNERFLYQVFEGDKSPHVQNALKQYGLHRKPRVKGSLMLIDLDIAKKMHDGQELASDSVINHMVGPENTRIADRAYFMHWGRIDLVDHIQARLRHYRGAQARSELEGYIEKQHRLGERDIERIADHVRTIAPEGGKLAQFYLLRNALRFQIDALCTSIVSGEGHRPFYDGTVSADITTPVHNMQDAHVVIGGLIENLDVSASLRGYSTTAPPTTQSVMPRTPLDLRPFLADATYRPLILDSFSTRRADETS